MRTLTAFARATAIQALALISIAAITAACGDSKSSMNPVAPSAVVVAGVQSGEAGAPDGESTTTGKPTNPGNGNGNGNGNSGPGNGNGNGNGQQPTAPGGQQPPGNVSPRGPSKVEIEGLISAKGSSTITVNGQVVSVPASAVIRHGDRRFTFADLHVGDRVHVKAARAVAVAPGAPSTIEATEVKLQNPGHDDDDGDDDDEDPPSTMLVSVAALDATASETGPDLGAFRFTRSGDTTAALTVTYTVTGTAANGTDYQSIPVTVTFAAGAATANVFVEPLPDATAEGPETVVLTVVDGAGYVAGSPATATVTIAG